MDLLWELIKLDLLATKDWFRKQTASKLVVALLYLLVLAGVGIGIFAWAGSFFRYLLAFESFGDQTGLYVIRSAMIVLTWIGVLSTLLSTMTFLLTPDRSTDLLITYPIPDIYISLRSTIRSFFVGLVLFSVSVFPLLLAYYLSRPSFSPAYAILAALFQLLFVLMISQFAGSSLGYIASIIIRKRRGLYYGALLTTGLIFVTWLLLRLVFPPELSRLPGISIEEYPTFFYDLPLMKDFWSTGWSTPIAVFLALIFTVISVTLQYYLFIPSWQLAKVHISMLKKETKEVSYRSVSLITKDILSIIRSPKDMVYLLFLLSMIIAFFGLFSRGYLVNSIPERFRVDAIAFSFSWLVFFSGTYLIRLAYPLMVNEGQSRWWFLTLPVFTYTKLVSKVAVSLLVSLPLLIVAFLEWALLPFTLSVPFLIILSLISLLLLAVLFPLIGSLYPDYKLAYKPDSASTSFTGLVAIIFVFVVGVLGASFVSQVLKEMLAPVMAINGFLIFAIITSAFVGALALHSSERYTLDA